jgi:hypothetical protein
MMALYGICRDLVIGCSVDADKDGKLGDVMCDAMNGLVQVYNALSNETDDTKEKRFTANEVVTAMVLAGQGDTKKFKLGETIRFSPSEDGKILNGEYSNE